MTRGLMTMMASRYERRAVERQRARWHDPVLKCQRAPSLCFLRGSGEGCQGGRRSRGPCDAPV